MGKSIIIKKINSELIYSKKYLIAKKTFNIKESFQCFYRKVIPVLVILVDSVYRKDGNHYPKVLFKKYSFWWFSWKISMKEIRMKKIKCLNLYLKNKWIARNEKHMKFLFFRLRKFPPEI